MVSTDKIKTQKSKQRKTKIDQVHVTDNCAKLISQDTKDPFKTIKNNTLKQKQISQMGFSSLSTI